MAFWNLASIESRVTFSRESVCVECYERIFGADSFERVIESEEAGEIGCVGDEGGPDCAMLGSAYNFAG